MTVCGCTIQIGDITGDVESTGSEEECCTLDTVNETLNALFPKDKALFLMCQSGGRIKTLMQILDANGYDMNKIYNVGGMSQYDSYDIVTNAEEIVVTDTYAFNGLTVNK